MRKNDQEIFKDSFSSMKNSKTDSMSIQSQQTDNSHLRTQKSSSDANNTDTQQDYADVLQMYTNCSEEYKSVFKAIDFLESAFKDLIRKVGLSEQHKADIVSSIMHKELINNIYAELQRLAIDLRKSSFFGRLLDQASWKKEFKREISKSFKSKSVISEDKSSVFESVYSEKKEKGIGKERKAQTGKLRVENYYSHQQGRRFSKEEKVTSFNEGKEKEEKLKASLLSKNVDNELRGRVAVDRRRDFSKKNRDRSKSAVG